MAYGGSSFQILDESEKIAFPSCNVMEQRLIESGFAELSENTEIARVFGDQEMNPTEIEYVATQELEDYRRRLSANQTQDDCRKIEKRVSELIEPLVRMLLEMNHYLVRR